jgi:hypothetical protein
MRLGGFAEAQVDIQAQYLTGDRTRSCCIRITEPGVALYIGKKAGAYEWDEIRGVSFDDPGRTKANIGAIAVFGVLGLASHYAFTLITLSTRDEDLYFESDSPVATWHLSARRIVEDFPAARGKVWVDGQPITLTPVSSASSAAARSGPRCYDCARVCCYGGGGAAYPTMTWRGPSGCPFDAMRRLPDLDDLRLAAGGLQSHTADAKASAHPVP